MSNRINALTVVLDQNYREDDCEEIVKAIQQFKGVVSVGVNVADPASFIAEQRVRYNLKERLWKLLVE